MSIVGDNSNDVVMVEPTEPSTSNPSPIDEDEDRPIMQLFHRLISNDSKQNTILTNIQIIAILQKEFGIDITELHDLEVDIYLNIVKKFLKDWPKWDEFDQGISSLRKQKAHHSNSIKRTLEKKYKNLKSYLKTIIDSTRPIAQETVTKMLEEHAKKMEKVDTSKTILEVYCTRLQLNELIHSQPIGENNIFNYIEHFPTAIHLIDIPLESILNYWKFEVKIELKSFVYLRTAQHELRHVLINKKNDQKQVKRVLKENIQIKEIKAQTRMVKTSEFVSLFREINSVVFNTSLNSFFETLFTVVMSDIDKMQQDIKVPAAYRQYCNKYPYYRKLSKPSSDPQLGSPYDLYIEETLSPLVTYSILKASPFDKVLPKQNWIYVDCGECRLRFKDFEVLNIFDHFKTCHTHELDWFCTNCDKSFSMVYLTQNRWCHDCET